MRLSLKLFEILNEIAKENDISQERWGEASGIPQPRISEFVIQLNGGKLSQSRHFTLTRYLQLFRGLKSILGEGTVKQAILKKAGSQKDKTVEMWAKLVILMESNDPKDREKIGKLEMFVDMLLKE
jgi:hypothetical protein